jgi:hypothetical protein
MKSIAGALVFVGLASFPGAMLAQAVAPAVSPPIPRGSQGPGGPHASTTGFFLSNVVWTAEGNQAGTGFGGSVASAGDVNGDGYADLIVGAKSSGLLGEGRVSVFHGPAPSFVPSWTTTGSQGGADFGICVASAGDVDGDGFDDVLVGASKHDGTEEDEGHAFLYRGSASGLPLLPTWVGQGNQASAYYGFTLAAAGDVNGDGYDDVIVGAPGHDNGEVDEGRAYVYHGSPFGLSSTPDWTVESNQIGAVIGGSVASAGDVDGDGFDDVIVGAQYYGALNQGRAFVYSGSSSGLSTSATEIVGSQIGAYLGNSVSSAGDVNGDGYDDVIVGEMRGSHAGQVDEGRAYVYHGSAAGLSTSAAWSAEGDQEGAYFGTIVAAAGDVNGDGFDDVLVGAPHDDGADVCTLYMGSAVGLTADPAWSDVGELGVAGFGSAVASAGDVNGDGRDDVIFGEPGHANPQALEGRASLRRGTQVAASHVVRNGNGSNPVGYAAVTQPVLGSVWHLTVDVVTPLHSFSVVALGAGGPVTGPILNGLVQGQLLALGPYVVSVGVINHFIPLPNDANLVNQTLATQAMTIAPGIVRLNNAIDARFGY